MKRYQEINRFSKLLRKRWYIYAYFIWVLKMSVYKDVWKALVLNQPIHLWEDDYLSVKEFLKLSWSVAKGRIQIHKMKFYYNFDEVFNGN